MGLPELLVAMAVASVVLVAVATTFATSLRLTSDVNSRTGALADARLAMDTVARRLRVAVRPPSQPAMVVAAGPSSLRFFASTTATGAYPTAAANGTTTPLPPTLVEYSLHPTSGCFEEALTPGSPAVSASGEPTYIWPVTNRRARCLVLGGVATGASPLFRYYDGATTATPLVLIGATPPLDLIRSVAVDVAVLEKPGVKVKPTVVQTRVSLANRLAEDATGKKS